MRTRENMPTIINVACPTDRKVVEKEEEQIEKYRDLAREVAKLWNVRVKIFPVVIGALGTIPNDLEERINEMGISLKIGDSRYYLGRREF